MYPQSDRRPTEHARTTASTKHLRAISHRGLTRTDTIAAVSTVLVATLADHVHEELEASLGGQSRIVRVAGGNEVLAAVREHQPDLVVLDLQIGNMGGMAACLDLRLEQRAGRIPTQRVVMLLDRDADTYLAGQAEADAWIVKPLNPMELRQTASAVMATDAP